MEALIKSIFLVAGLLCGIVPAIAWMERRQQLAGATPADEQEASDAGFLKRAVEDLDAALRVLADPGEAPTHARRVLHRVTPAIAVLVPLAGFAWIPVAGSYTGDHISFRGAAADSEVGVLLVAALLMLACAWPAIAGYARQDRDSLQLGLRATGLAASFQLPLLLAIASVCLGFESLALAEIAAAQDRAVPIAGALEATFGPTLPALANAKLPAWGLFFQPVAFLIFFIAALASGPEASLEAAHARELDPQAGMPGRPGLYRLAGGVHLALVAALATTLFFGGFAVPGLATSTIVTPVAKIFGFGLAFGFCALIHVAFFTVKLLFVVWLMLVARALLTKLDAAQWMRVCWLGLLPASALHLFANAALVVWWTS